MVGLRLYDPRVAVNPIERNIARSDWDDFIFEDSAFGKYGMMRSSHAFNVAVDDALHRCLDISNQRASEYSDSWSLEAPNIFLDLVLREIEAVIRTRLISAKEKRLIRIASLCDTKLARLGGPFKADTLDDFLNYCAALRGWLEEYKNDSGAHPGCWSTNLMPAARGST